MKKAFTLIELLVVVLIIGILAAVAVPQYQKAVQKSRATQLQTLLASVAQAGEVYSLANGAYPISFEKMDVNVVGTLTPAEQAACWGNLNARATYKGSDFEITLYDGGIDQRYLVAAYFTSGKYKCTGFTYYFKMPDDTLNHHMFCTEYYYNRECGTAGCGKDEFCKNVMSRKYKTYFGTTYIYE